MEQVTVKSQVSELTAGEHGDGGVILSLLRSLIVYVNPGVPLGSHVKVHGALTSPYASVKVAWKVASNGPITYICDTARSNNHHTV